MVNSLESPGFKLGRFVQVTIPLLLAPRSEAVTKLIALGIASATEYALEATFPSFVTVIT